jgi:hypothetical protein
MKLKPVFHNLLHRLTLLPKVQAVAADGAASRTMLLLPNEMLAQVLAAKATAKIFWVMTCCMFTTLSAALSKLLSSESIFCRRDYEQRGVLDHYDPGMLDEREQRGMTVDQRLRAEQEMAVRDRSMDGRRLPGMDDIGQDGGMCPPAAV